VTIKHKLSNQPGPSLKGRALRLLSNREHSKLELIKKLKVHAQTPEELSQVMDWLQAKGFINEKRVLESVIYRRATKLGFARVARELQEKGLDSEAIANAVHELKSSERQRASDVWFKKFKNKALTPSERAKQTRFLLSRGFAPSVVSQVVNSAGQSESEHLVNYELNIDKEDMDNIDNLDEL